MKLMLEEHGGAIVSVIVSMMLLGIIGIWGGHIAGFLQKFAGSLMGG